MVSLEEAWRPHTPSFRVERMWAANRIAIAGLIHVKTSAHDRAQAEIIC